VAPDDWIPEPTVFLVGCQAWPPRVDGDASHILNAEEMERWLSEPIVCPVCGGGIKSADTSVHCGYCSSSHPSIETRCRGAQLGLKAKSRAEQAEQQAKAKLRQARWPVLSEIERRRIWNGYKHSAIREYVGELSNAAKAGREFLETIGQLPDWSIKVQRVGRTVRVVA